MSQRLSLGPTVDPTARITQGRPGRYTEVGACTRLTETALGDHYDIVEDGEGIDAESGKFCSIAAAVRIDPGDHPMERASQARFTCRASAYWREEANEAALFARRRVRAVTIGYDVRTGHGAVVPPGAASVRARWSVRARPSPGTSPPARSSSATRPGPSAPGSPNRRPSA